MDTRDALYVDWMRKVDALLVKRCGLCSADLPDFCYRDAFDDGESPSSVARSVLEEAGSDL